MKLERMLSIITYLLNHDKVKAQELADKFEVSVRTIYRDIDAISSSGIPVTAYQGADGGLGIMEGYKLDKSLLTNEEVFKIVTALKGLHSISRDVKIKLLIEKLTNITDKSDYIPTGSEIMIDLSSWNKNDRLGLKIKEIKKAIQERKIIEFTYVNNEVSQEYCFEKKGVLLPFKRKVEPCVIVFKESNWYLYAFCLLRQEFRLFKLRRINDLIITEDSFETRNFSLDNVDWDIEADSNKLSVIVALFDRSMEYSVNDIFGLDSCETAEDGRLKVTFHMGISGWLYGFLLGFGDKIEVLEPPELREKIKSIAENICLIY